jgi:hypothetical protein
MCLKRAIYGLKQAALAWWKALDGSMSRLGCKRLLSDLSRSHKGTAGMRSVLTFEKVVWIVDARVER